MSLSTCQCNGKKDGLRGREGGGSVLDIIHEVGGVGGGCLCRGVCVHVCSCECTCMFVSFFFSFQN